jgi:hypothetical protein
VRKWLVGVLCLVVVAVLAVGLWAFEPWRLFTSSEIDEALPTASPSATSTTGMSNGPTTSPSTTESRELASGAFESAEHTTSGAVRIVELADGRRFVRLEQLDSSDGPDLHVWITDQPSGGEWGSYDDGRYVALGELKATHGNQNYAIPDGTDLTGLRSVVIWCDRFNVAFGTAPVTVAG